MLDALDKKMLKQIADLDGTPKGAYNIRRNGEGAGRNSTDNVKIESNTEHPGITITVKPHTKGEKVYIPVILTQDLTDVVYNNIDIGEYADVEITAGCGIHNAGNSKSQHDGVHEFFVKTGAHLKYIEKHYGEGNGKGERVLNPKTIIHVDENASVELELIQISGIDSTMRDTDIDLGKGARLVITERLLTTGEQQAKSSININVVGADASAQIISRSVARDDSKQDYYFDLIGKNRCRGHIQCDAIIMDHANVTSTPKVSALHSEAQLVHEAAIGRLESQQLIKLMSLGLTEQQAEEEILQGFLR